MNLVDTLVLFVVGPVFVLLVWVVSVLIWRRGLDAYDAAHPVHILVGPHGRDGFNASVPALSAFVTGTYTGVLVLMLNDKLGTPGLAVLGGVLIYVGLGSLVLSWSLLLFLRPRFLVPPHLRGDEHDGWVQAAWRARRDLSSENGVASARRRG